MMSVRNAMKTRLAFVAVLSLFAVCSFAANGTMKGDGSAEKPFQIEDYEDLKAIGKGAYLYSSNYILTKDIDASASKNEMCNEDGCNGFISIGKKKDAADSVAFWGTIDGQNHTISNLTIWLPCEQEVGFIYALVGSVKNLIFDHLHVTGRVSESNHVGGVVARLVGTIENVHVTNGFVQGKKRVGGIAGCAMRTIGYSNEILVVKDVSFQGEIKGTERVGGIVGETDGASIDNAFADVNIIAMDGRVGGIVGYNSGKIMNSRASGSITPAYEGVDDVGGIAGYSGKWGVISQCISEMDLLNVTRSSMICRLDEGVGGIVGSNHGTVSESYAKGTIEGVMDVGGIVGWNVGSVQNTFALGSVKGEKSVGGLVGGNVYQFYDDRHGSIFNSYAANVVKGDSGVGGLVGYNSETVESSYWNTEISGLDTSAGGTGLSTAKMMKMASFAGWDTVGYWEYEYVEMDLCNGWCYNAKEFVKTWGIDEGKSFPYLTGNPFSKTALIPIAVPTSAVKWQEQPKVAAMHDVGEELFGEWLNLAQINETKDSIYHWYRIGYAVGTDTVWGTSSYMAVPNKIEISSYDELKKIGNDLAYPLVAHYELTKDIDASSSKFTPIGDSIHMFTGSFDGKNHTIKNLVIDEPNRDFTGMFGYAESATIENLTLENAKVVGSWVVGALVGEGRGVTVRHVVSLNGDVAGEHSVGGLAGSFIGSSMEFVGTTGKVKGTENVGGIIGYMRGSTKMSDAFSVNVIKGFEDVGGVIGYSYDYGDKGRPKIHRTYSASMFKAPKSAAKGILGGLNGYVIDDTTCFFDSTVAVIAYGGKTTAEMLQQATYYSYDFETVWEIQEDVSYPYFKGKDPILPGMLEDDGTVNVLAGAGTEINPYKIYDYDDLEYIGKYEYGLDKHYKLMGNINAASSFRENCNADSTLCKGFEPIGEFSGVFDGNNKVIAGLNINRPDEDSVGLFRALAAGARVSGIVFDTASYFRENYLYSSGAIKGVIRGKDYVGTVAGVDNGAAIEKIYVKNRVLGENYVGGVVGKKTSGSIALSASRDTVSGAQYVGGFVGSLNKAVVSDCYSLAAVSGTKNVGGLAGYSNNAIVKNSYGAGNVTGTSKLGGLAGEDVKSTYTSAYYDSTLWLITTTAAGELRTTHQMVKQENYQGWDFENTWKIAADTTYPYLTWITKAYYLGSTINQKYSPDKYRDSTMMHIAGSGTESDPFIIKTYSDLKSIGLGKYKLSAVYRLGNDIDASASKNERLDYYSTGFKSIGNVRRYITGIDIQDTSKVFTGKIHGAGHSITGLYISASQYSYYGACFIDSIGEGGVVDSLSLIDFEIHGQYAAGFAMLNNGTIKDVSVNGTVEASDVGVGLVETNNGTIENALLTGMVYSENKKKYYDVMLAGFVNENSGVIRSVRGNLTVKGAIHGGAGIAFENTGKIEDVKVKAELDLGGSHAAGIVAVNSGTVSACSASVSIAADSSVGGIVGDNSGTVSACNASVDITSKGSYVGGVAGKNSGTISACTTSVSIESEGSYVGGLIGRDEGIIEKFAVTGAVKGLDYVGGFIGDADGKKDFASLHTAMDVAGRYYVGGLFGKTSRKISKSYTTANVKGTMGWPMDNYDGARVTGGLVGFTSADMDSCYSTASVEKGGGLVGVIRATLTNSYASGEVVDGSGLVSGNMGVIRNCYTTGHVAGGTGFVGKNMASAVIENCYSTADVETGAGFVDYNKGTINKCYAAGTVKSSKGSYVTGFAINNGGTITESYTTIDLENGDAGFVWQNEPGGLIDRCYVTGDIHISTDGGGGFVFRNDGTIRRSFVTGDVYAETKSEIIHKSGLNNIGTYYIGGFASVNNKEGVIEMCFATGDIEGRFHYAGAFAGNNKGAINNSYATGNLKRHAEFLDDSSMTETKMFNIGTFIGENEGKVDYDYATGYFEDYDGKRYCATLASTGGGVAFYYNSDSCTTIRESIWVGNAVSDAALHKKSTFKDFDFDSVWYIKDGKSYPQLRGMPNVPYVGAESLNYGKGGITAQHVLGTLRDRAIVADTSYALVILPDSASKALLDSLEKQGKKAGGDYTVDYRVGVAVTGDTIWSKPAKASLAIEKSTGVVAPQVVKADFNAALDGANVALRFGLASAGVAKFSLLDVQGRVVRSFDLGRRAAGDYFESLAVESLARGRYIGMLQVNGKVNHKVLMLKK